METLKSKVNLMKVSRRNRHSPYPMISIDDALECVLKESNNLKTTKKSFPDCYSYVTAEAILAPENYPPFPASIKDGYAVLAGDLSEVRKVIGSVTPGCQLDFDITYGTCVRISTGSAIPTKADAVIQVEDTEVVEEDEEGNEIKIKILKQAVKNQDIRDVGSDVVAQQVLVMPNQRVSPSEMGIMATFGIQSVLVYEKPRVALLSTGDEIVTPDSVLQPGCIRDSNKSSLYYSLLENRIPVVDIGISKDLADDVKCSLTTAFKAADIVITSGGVSMGERDILKQVLEIDFNATIHFGRINMKPGKPCTFSTLAFEGEKKLVFSLPGNPVSTCVCFELFVVPCIKRLMGYSQPIPDRVTVKLAKSIQLDPRPEFIRATVKTNELGLWECQPTGPQQSSCLLSMIKADALLCLPAKGPAEVCLDAGIHVPAIFLRPF